MARKAFPEDLREMGMGLQLTYAEGRPVYRMLADHELPPLPKPPPSPGFSVTTGPAHDIISHYLAGRYYEQSIVATFPSWTFEVLQQGAQLGDRGVLTMKAKPKNSQVSFQLE